MYKASLDTKAQLPHRKQALRVQGIVFEDIAPVSRACDSTNVHNRREADLRVNWAELAFGDTDTDAYIAGGTNVNALQHTLCIDTQIIDRHRITCGGSVARLDSATCKEWWASFSSPILVQDATHYRRLIKTSLGYFGHAPYQWQTGDIVWILFGSQFPMILRPEDGHFFLVGHCYVHGIMDSEALEEMDLKKETRTFVI
jgi:hypothetical protein